MECDQMEKVSQLIDGELSDDEAALIMSHVANCQICARACGDFTLLRRELKLYDLPLGSFVKQRVLRNLIASQHPPLWRRRIAIPVPVMAVFLIALLVVALSSTVRLSRMPPASQSVNVKPITTESQSQAAFNLSRFDHGGRAAIEKIKQGPSSANQ